MQLVACEEFKKVKRTKIITDSRYSFNYHLYDGKIFFLPSQCWDNNLRSSTSPNYTVLAGEAARLDIVAQRQYRQVRVWWAIARDSNIGNPLRVKAGDLLSLPSQEKIFTEFVG